MGESIPGAASAAVSRARVRCIASPRRIRWALLRTGLPNWTYDLDDVSVQSARVICDAAGVPFSALYLPDPSGYEMVKAWFAGRLR